MSIALPPRRPVPARPPRDQRLDVLRGLLQLTIFVAHAALIAPGSSVIGGWIVHTAWGLSDSSEQFIFSSGLGLGMVFTLKFARDGFGAAHADLLRRAWRLYRTHLLLLAGFGAVIFAAAATPGLPNDIDRLGWRMVTQNPFRALALIPPMVFQPQFMEIIPVFVLCTLMVGPFLWLVDRIGDRALAAPLALYAATHILHLALPATGPVGHTEFGFNPFAWQLLYLFGAWLGRRSLLTQGRAVSHHKALVAAAIAMIVWGFFVRITTYGWFPREWLPFGWVPPFGWLIIKENLGPVLLLHGLALAYLCVVLLPREHPLYTRGIFPLLMAAGRHSLRVFCLGLFLSWGVSVVLRAAGYSYALDALLLALGCALLLAWGARLERPARTVAVQAG